MPEYQDNNKKEILALKDRLEKFHLKKEISISSNHRHKLAKVRGILCSNLKSIWLRVKYLLFKTIWGNATKPNLQIFKRILHSCA